VLGLAAGLSALGCTTGAGLAARGSPAEVVHDAPDRTLAAGSAAVSIGIGVAVGPGVAGTGVVDLRSGRARMEFQRTGAGARSGDRFDVVVDGGTGYLSGSGLSGWTGGPLPAVAVATRARIAPLDSLLVRPGAGLALALLRGAEKVLPYGGEEIEGTSTLRYSFVVDLAAATAASPKDQRPALQAAAAFIGSVQEPADVWLDSAGRVRRLKMATNPLLRSTTTKANFFTEDGEVISFVVIDFSRFGAPATIDLPLPSSVRPVA